MNEYEEFLSCVHKLKRMGLKKIVISQDLYNLLYAHRPILNNTPITHIFGIKIEVEE